MRIFVKTSSFSIPSAYEDSAEIPWLYFNYISTQFTDYKSSYPCLSIGGLSAYQTFFMLIYVYWFDLIRSQEEIRPRFRNEFNSKKINSNKKINIKKQDGFVTKTPQNQQQQQVHQEEPQFGRPNQDQQQKIELLQQLQEERFRQQQRLQKDAPNQQLAQSHQNAFQRQQLQQVNVQQQQQARQQQPGGLFDQLRRIIESQLVQRDNPRKRSGKYYVFQNAQGTKSLNCSKVLFSRGDLNLPR